MIIFYNYFFHVHDRKLPGVRGIVEQELNKSLTELKEDLSKQV